MQSCAHTPPVARMNSTHAISMCTHTHVLPQRHLSRPCLEGPQCWRTVASNTVSRWPVLRTCAREASPRCGPSTNSGHVSAAPGPRLVELCPWTARGGGGGRRGAALLLAEQEQDPDRRRDDHQQLGQLPSRLSPTTQPGNAAAGSCSMLRRVKALLIPSRRSSCWNGSAAQQVTPLLIIAVRKR